MFVYLDSTFWIPLLSTMSRFTVNPVRLST